MMMHIVPLADIRLEWGNFVFEVSGPALTNIVKLSSSEFNKVFFEAFSEYGEIPLSVEPFTHLVFHSIEHYNWFILKYG